MAVTGAGAKLTEGHRRAQIRTLDNLLAWFVAEWSTDVAFDPATFVAFVQSAAPEVAAAYQLSAEVAERYYRAFRAAEGIPGVPAVVRLAEMPPEAFVRELERTNAPGYARALRAAGMGDAQAARRVLARVMLSATQSALAGGRDMLAESLSADPRALGWQRVASSSCCAFCALLAARGPVYGTARSAGRGRHWHPGCKCTVEPVFSRRTKLPATSRRYAEIWREVGTGNLADFRRRLERPELFAKKREQREA